MFYVGLQVTKFKQYNFIIMNYTILSLTALS
jgi:hypothetical protein